MTVTHLMRAPGMLVPIHISLTQLHDTKSTLTEFFVQLYRIMVFLWRIFHNTQLYEKQSSVCSVCLHLCVCVSHLCVFYVSVAQVSVLYVYYIYDEVRGNKYAGSSYRVLIYVIPIYVPQPRV